MIMDKYKIKDYTERLKKETTKNAHKMLYMWIKQDVISLGEFQELVKNCSIPDVVGQSEQGKALEDLKDFAYDNCQPHNSDRLSEIMERL